MSTKESAVWATLEQAKDYLAVSHGVILRLMISMAANPQPQPGWIRFRVVECQSGKREPRLWWEDVLAIRPRAALSIGTN